MFKRLSSKKYAVTKTYSKLEKQNSKLLKNLEKHTFNKKITKEKIVSTDNYSNDQLISMMKVYYVKCLEMHKNTIYYITVNFIGESISFYSIQENNVINHKIVLNDRVSYDCLLIKPKEYYQDKECSICYEKPDITLKCGHDFHNSCLSKYIKTQRVKQLEQQTPQERRLSNSITIDCPICREFIF